MSSILVVGGAGYIGSHMVKQLSCAGHSVIVLDNLSTGFRKAARFGKLVVGDLADTHLLERLFREHRFDGVMHFAACSLVGESMQKPGKYYRNNVVNTLNILDMMVRHEVKHLIFSSTAATFGEPEYVPIDKVHPQRPINPYGTSKLMVERILKDYHAAYGLNSVCLRYFNACGADPEGDLGECHDPETHLIPLILQAASGRRESITVFGRDYPTEDGTCIRDYIHIEDLCSAHALALEALVSGKKQGALAYNLGNGQGFSVQQVIGAVQRIVGEDWHELKVEEGARRPGDPAVLVADATLAKRELGWQPHYAELETIIRHAWAWEKKLAGQQQITAKTEPKAVNSYQEHYRTAQKVNYAQLMLQHLKKSPSRATNDDWDNAVTEAFFYHLAGACEYLLHEINVAQSLGLKTGEVKRHEISKRLEQHGRPSPAFEYWKAQRDDSDGFLALLCELRNAGTHRHYLNKYVFVSSHDMPDNKILDSRTGEPPQRYPELGAISLMEKLLEETHNFIAVCRRELYENNHI